MCGIAGMVDLTGKRPIDPQALARMAAAILHRGPDEGGFRVEQGIGLANRRLSIVGLKDGKQPIFNEDRSVVVVFNGELFDYPEKKAWLTSLGHQFRTSCDTEILVHLYEQFGERIFCLRIFVPQAQVEVLEIFDPAVNKWEGVSHVARLHGVRPEQIIAIGDDVNDVHMIRHAGLGVAMGNAKPEIKAIAKRVIGANADEGLAAFLEELVALHAVEPMREAGERGEAAA